MSDDRAVRIGLLRLTDAAPVIVAQERGLFARHGLSAVLSVEPSWANIADKLAYGLLDAAVILPPLAIAACLGLRGPRADLIVPMTLSQGGISVTVSNEVARRLPERHEPGGIMQTGRAIGAWLHAASGTRPRLAVVHLFSGHNLLLRYWLAACGIDPDRDLELLVVPPVEMVAALADGRIDGFCAGAPWGVLAERQQVGRVVALGSDIWNRHPEKALAVRRAWADDAPGRLGALLRALVDAARLCDDPAEADAVAQLLADPAHVGAAASAIRTSLGGAGEPPRRDADRIGFFANAATIPWMSQAAWFACQMSRWGWLAEAEIPSAIALYRPDLYRGFLEGCDVPIPLQPGKPEGGHDTQWSMAGTAGRLSMQPDLFCDGSRFSDAGILRPG